MDPVRFLLNCVALRVVRSALAALAVAIFATGADAAEGAHGVYLMGLRAAPGVGITGPEGVYTSSSAYYYAGWLGANRLLPAVGGVIEGQVKTQVPIGLIGLSWMTPAELLGGRLGFSVLQPFGGPAVSAGLVGATPFLPGAALTRGRSQSIATAGDPAVSTFLGWHYGNLHWTMGVTGFIPVGDYHKGALANIANHRGSVDINGAATYAHPALGFDLSSAVGVTFNTENTATRYKTGDELHLEWAATKSLAKEISVGVMGYHYNQLSDDTGEGASLGGFRGRATAVGGLIAVRGMVGELPIAANIRVFREVEVKNRLQGTGGFLTITMPLWVAQAGKP